MKHVSAWVDYKNDTIEYWVGEFVWVFYSEGQPYIQISDKYFAYRPELAEQIIREMQRALTFIKQRDDDFAREMLFSRPKADITIYKNYDDVEFLHFDYKWTGPEDGVVPVIDDVLDQLSGDLNNAPGLPWKMKRIGVGFGKSYWVRDVEEGTT